MAERLPRDTIDRLGRSIWRIAQLGMAEDIEKVDRLVKIDRPFRFDNLLLEVLVELSPHHITDRPELRFIEATINEIESYEPNPELDVYHFKTVGIDVWENTRQYDTGANFYLRIRS